MADFDSLIRFRDAALKCNEAATNAAALVQGIRDGGPGEILNPDALPFPRGQTLPGHAGEPLEEAVSRGAPSKWISELETALASYSAARPILGGNDPLEEIENAAVSLRQPPVRIGIRSFLTAHEGVQHRAMVVRDCLKGERSKLPDGAMLDLSAQINMEFRKAVTLRETANSMPLTAKREQGEGNDTPAEQVDAPRPATKAKRSTERGEGRVKLIAALTKHHKYADGSCLNQEPIGNNELARLAGVDGSTASAFFKREFQGLAKYKVACTDTGKLVAMLKLLNGEYSPYLLYGDKPPDEDEREDE